MRSPSRGLRRLKSRDPHAHPAILFNYMSHEQDWQEFRDAIRITWEIMNQLALDKYRGAEISPGIDCQSDAELDSLCNHAETAFHPCGTCKMVTTRWRWSTAKAVHGLEGAGDRCVDYAADHHRQPERHHHYGIGEKMVDAIRGRQRRRRAAPRRIMSLATRRFAAQPFRLRLSFPRAERTLLTFQHPLAIKARLNNAINSSIHLFLHRISG